MDAPKTRWFDSIDDVSVATHDYGGSGHPTLFVHGTGLASRMWEPVMDALGAEFRCIAVDLRAHGASRHRGDPSFHDHRMVADVCSVIDGMSLEGAWGIGHSMGAATSMLASLARPNAYSRLWAYEPIIFPRLEVRPEGAFDFATATRKRRPVFSSRAEAIESYGSRPPLDELHPACLAAYVEHGFVDQPDGTVRLSCEPRLESRAYEDYLQDGWDRLPELTTPVLVACGTESQDRPQATAGSIAERLPDGHLEVFEGSGHFGCFGPLDRAVSSIRTWFLGEDA